MFEEEERANNPRAKQIQELCSKALRLKSFFFFCDFLLQLDGGWPPRPHAVPLCGGVKGCAPSGDISNCKSGWLSFLYSITFFERDERDDGGGCAGRRAVDSRVR